jgi:hypothetical protein
METVHTKPNLLLLWLIAILMLQGCNQSPPASDKSDSEMAPAVDLDTEKTALLKLQAVEQEAHLTEQPALLVHMLSDTFCQVKNGEVKYFSQDEMTDHFVKYFYSVEFVTWNDIKPPVITLSPDGLMAHILVTKEVELILSEQDKPTREKTNYAWTELWKKKNGQWKLHTVTTTEKPGVVNE